MDYYDLLQEPDNQCGLTDRNKYFRTNKMQQTNNEIPRRNQEIENKLKTLTRKAKLKVYKKETEI